MNARPQLSQSGVPLLKSVSLRDEHGQLRTACMPGEHPLTIYVDKQELVTLMTLGAAPEMLVLGYLRNQKLLKSIADIESIQVDWEVNAAAVVTHRGIDNLRERTQKRVVTSGCGQGTLFGDMLGDIEQIRLNPDARLRQSVLYKIVNTIRLQDSIYKQAGSVHGCGLFSAEGELLCFVEDVGRHNAVDSIAGQMWIEGIHGEDKIFYTTGRLTSEMVMKGAQMGIPFLLSRSGVTAMGYEVAQKVKMTVLGRCTYERFLIFSGEERFVRDVDTTAARP